MRDLDLMMAAGIWSDNEVPHHLLQYYTFTITA